MKRKNIIIAFIAMVLIITSYYFFHKKNQPIYVNAGCITRPIDELKKLVLKGDTVAYIELRDAYTCNVKYKEYEGEYLIYSVIMADKYNYPTAYFNVYCWLTMPFEHMGAGKIDKRTESLALEYLRKGVELNDFQSINELSNLYYEGKYVSKDSVMGKKLEKKGSQVGSFKL